jgi:hypothetical protein
MGLMSCPKAWIRFCTADYGCSWQRNFIVMKHEHNSIDAQMRETHWSQLIDFILLLHASQRKAILGQTNMKLFSFLSDSASLD